MLIPPQCLGNMDDAVRLLDWAKCRYPHNMCLTYSKMHEHWGLSTFWTTFCIWSQPLQFHRMWVVLPWSESLVVTHCQADNVYDGWTLLSLAILPSFCCEGPLITFIALYSFPPLLMHDGISRLSVVWGVVT